MDTDTKRLRKQITLNCITENLRVIANVWKKKKLMETLYLFVINLPSSARMSHSFVFSWN